MKRKPNNYYVVDEGDNVANVFHDSDWDENGKYIENGGEDGYDFADFAEQIVFTTTSFKRACEVCDSIIDGTYYND